MKEQPELSGKSVVVVGLGVSGYWAAKWLASMAAIVTVSDLREAGDLDQQMVQDLSMAGVKLETGSHSADTFLSADMIVISPGVPHDMGILVEARKKGIWVTGELELASRFIDAQIVAITGTNGKSTVTSMIGHVLKKAGRHAHVGGNIGTPLSAFLAKGLQAEIIVVEVSSFQLDTIETFRPRVAVLLNINRDHLDRYGGFGDYVESKLRIFQNQVEGDLAILCDDDPILEAVELCTGRPGAIGRAELLRYGIKKRKDRQAYISKDRMIVGNCTSHGFSVKDYKLKGIHNLQNLLAVGLACIRLGIDPEVFQSAIGEFRALPHRMELVGEVNGVSFYNDSKATNVDAAVRAIEAIDGPLVLIAGGRDKGASYAPLLRAMKGRARGAIVIGEAADLIEKALVGVVPCQRAESLQEAVREAYTIAVPGDSILLAPACSSFDMFANYEERGEKFREAVRAIQTNGQG